MPEVLAELTLQDFEPLVGSRFECRRPEDDSVVVCELREASPLGGAPTDPGQRQSFSLLFLAAVEEVLPQRMYSVSHSAFTEPLDLFLVPVGQADGGLQLEAIFN